MGVHGLTSYVAQYATDCFKDYKLHDCIVLVDGNSAASLVYSTLTQSNHAFGGDYDQYSCSIKNFIAVLQKCEIRPIFIFDGGYELRKIKTILERIKLNVIICGQYKHKYREGRTFPLLLRDVFRMVLQELNIPTIQCDFEADHEIVTLARILKCPVISNDSDFYISNVDYIPFTKIEFKSVKFKRKSGKKSAHYLPCQIFNEENFLKRVGGLSDKSLLPLLSCVLGNDYIPIYMFKGFLDMNSSIKFDERIRKIVKWLKSVESMDSAIEQLLATLKRDKVEMRQKIEQMVFEFNRTSTDLLDIITSNFDSTLRLSEHCLRKSDVDDVNDSVNISLITHENETQETIYFEGDNSINDGLTVLHEEEYEILRNSEDYEYSEDQESNDELDNELAPWLREKFRFGLISPTVINVHNFQKIFIVSQSEDYFAKPSHEICLPVMQLMISIVLRNKPHLSVKCHARWKRMVLGVNTLPQISEIPFYGTLPTLASVPNLSCEDRRKIILCGLKIATSIDLNPFPEEWKLYIITLGYWKQHCSQPVVNRTHIRTLFMCLIFLNFIDEKLKFVRTCDDLENLRKNFVCDEENTKMSNNSTDTKTNVDFIKFSNFDHLSQIKEILNEKDCYQVAEMLLPYHHVDPYLLKDRKQFDLKIIHAFAQLQHCIQSIIVLNSVLDYPFYQLRPHLLFSGTFIYNLYQELQAKKLPDGYVTKMLLGKAKSLIPLYSYLMNSWDNCFLTEDNCSVSEKSKVPRRKRKPKKTNKKSLESNSKEKEYNGDSDDEEYNDVENVFSALSLE